MKYTVLIYEREADFKARTDETRKAAYWGAYRAYTQALQEAGIMVRGRRARAYGSAGRLPMTARCRPRPPSVGGPPRLSRFETVLTLRLSQSVP